MQLRESRVKPLYGAGINASGKVHLSDKLSQSIDEQLLAMSKDEIPFASHFEDFDKEYTASITNIPPLSSSSIDKRSEIDLIKGRNANMNMSIRMPSTEDVSQLAENELGLDSARLETYD